MLASKLLSAMSSGADAPIYSDDVFSAYTYGGNGSSQTINNGIDLAGNGGMVWIKERSNSGGYGHRLFNTNAGPLQALKTHATSAQASEPDTVTAFNAHGFSFGSSVVGNASGATFVAWTFRKAPKFFDVQTVSHTNGTPTNISLSSLGTVGAVITKITTTTGDWITWHRSLTAANNVRLNTTGAQSTVNAWLSVSGTTATMASDAPTGTYAVYAFAHDTTPDGIIQCGSFTTDATRFGDVSLGWEPQYMLFKRTDNTSSWLVLDSMRGFARNGTKVLSAEGTYPEDVAGSDYKYPTATGARLSDTANGTHLYIAIRRPNKPPTTGTQVYKSLTHIGTGSVGSTTAVGFPPDLAISQTISAGRAPTWVDRLRGVTQWLRSDAGSAEGTQTTSGLYSFDMLGVSYTVDNTEQPFAWNKSGEAKLQRFFRRAPGFMDVVCYTGTGAASQLITHSLAVSPELVIIKRRNGADSWMVYASSQALLAVLNQTGGFVSSPAGRFSGVSASTFTVSSDGGFGANAGTYVAYLFASLPGISKVGSYTGNGSSQTINCGFSTGARFILLKRTDSTGDWYVWDTARGIIAANDPHLSLNTTSAEVTTNDSVDPDSTGFIVNQVAATNINVNGATYIFLSIA